MQSDAEFRHDLLRLRKNIIEEKHESVVALLPGLAQGVAEIHLAASVGCEIFDEKRAFAVVNIALDLGVAAEAFRLLSDILHREHEPVREPSGIGNPSRLAAGDHLKTFIADFAARSSSRRNR